MPYLFLSASKDDLNFALRIKARLEDEGYTIWFDEGREYVSPVTSLSLVEDVIQSASAVIAINGGNADDIVLAGQYAKPILAFSFDEDPEQLLLEIESLLPDRESAGVTPLPKPMDTLELERLEQRHRRGRPQWRSIVTVVVIVLVILGAFFVRRELGSRSRGVSTLAVVLLPSAIATGTIPPTATFFATQAAATAIPAIVIDTTTVIPLSNSSTPTPRPLNILASPEAATARPILPAATHTPAPTNTVRFTATATQTETAVPTATDTLTPTVTATATATITPSLTWTPTATFTATATLTPIPTSTIPALDSTLIPQGSANSFWMPIERQIRGVAMVYAPGGCFISGAGQPGNPTGESLCLDPYWISKTEVTNEQYAACVDAGACSAPVITSSRTHQDYFEDSRFADYPVINVTWEQAQAYATWAGAALPSQLQWRYAVQGPANWPYPWGTQSPDPTRLNFNGEIGDVTVVGSYPTGASWLGALDLAGNVWEWTSTSTTGENKVICGGSWNSYEGLISANSHAENPETDSNGYTGFRIVMDAVS